MCNESSFLSYVPTISYVSGIFPDQNSAPLESAISNSNVGSSTICVNSSQSITPCNKSSISLSY